MKNRTERTPIGTGRRTSDHAPLSSLARRSELPEINDTTSSHSAHHMTRDIDPTLLLPRSIRTLPADLAAIVVLVIAADVAVLAPLVAESPLRIVFGLPLVFFVPGYALVAALFPEDGGSMETSADSATGRLRSASIARGIDGLERIALPVGLSIAVVPLIGLVLNFTPFGIRLVPIVFCLSAFTLLVTAIATVRRRRLPEAARFRVSYKRRLASARSELFRPDSRADATLNVLLAVSLVLASASVGYATLAPRDGEQFTEFYLLTENESGGLAAADYPTNFTRGQGEPLVVGIQNHEGESKRYTVVVALQRVDQRGNETTVLEQRELRRFRAQVGANETWTRAHEITPTMTGQRLRIVYLLYRGSPPTDPGVTTAYRELHLWINASEPS